jgi:hypothetical protein
LGVARIAEQLAAPLQIGADAGHLGGEAEAVSKLFGPQDRLAGLSLDAGQVLFGKAHEKTARSSRSGCRGEAWPSNLRPSAFGNLRMT